MRAMQIIEWGQPLEARDYPDPEPQGEEVLLRVEAAGVCHSDVHIWDGHFDLGGGQQISLASRGVNLPFTMGHEIAGEVAALGPRASGVKIGGKVVVADIDGQKRAHARQMGAGATIDKSAPDAVKQVMAATGGGAAAAIDFVGSPKTMEFGVSVLKKGGKLVMVGLYGGAHTISTVLFPCKMMTIEGSYVGTLEDLRQVLALVQGGKVPPIPLETRPADQASAALSDLKSGGKVRGRMVLHHH